MVYDCQRELDSLIQQCDDMEESINAAGVLALNYIDDPAEVYNNSSVNIQITDERWIKLCQDFDTFFSINPDEKRKAEFEVLKQRTQIVTKDALSSVRVLINAIKNDFIVRDTTNNIATDADNIEYANSERKKLIFISHSTQDKEYTKAFVDLLFAIGLNEDDIVCSSYPSVGIPLGEKVYEWLVEKFQEYDLHVLYFLSHNYYQSAACLNEMGAAWAMKQKWDGILLPDFGFSDIAGCIDPTQIGIKLDGDIDELKHRLGELKDSIVAEFGMRTVSNTRWEKIRNNYISTIQEITSEPKQTKTDYIITPIDADDDTITIYACVMLLYAAEDDGQIMVLQTLSGTSYQAGKVTLERNQKPREIALWDDAVARLLKKGYIKKIGRKDPLFQVTTIGYSIADGFKEDNELDCSKTPAEILEEFETE